MRIMDRLQACGAWIKAKIQAARSRWGEQEPQVRDEALKVGGYLFSPLTEIEYALLKRVSGIVVMAVAVYFILTSGIGMALVVIDLGVLLMFGLYKVATQTRESDQRSE